MESRGYSYFNSFNTKISFDDPKLVYLKSFEMNQQQNYERLSFYIGWMRGMHMCNNGF